MTTGARFLVLWGTPQDRAEFDRHYREVHIPLAKKLPGLRRYTQSAGTRSPSVAVSLTTSSPNWTSMTWPH
jgi:uncharacterized protein (TIGR02118 family)